MYQQDGKVYGHCYALPGYSGGNDTGTTADLPYTPSEPVELGATGTGRGWHSLEGGRGLVTELSESIGLAIASIDLW